MLLKNNLEFVSLIERNIRVSESACQEWATKFAESPCYALSWSYDAFQHAANLKIWSQIKKNAMGGTFEDLRIFALRKILMAAQYPPRSTSVVSNLTEQSEAVCWAEVYEIVNVMVMEEPAESPV